MHAEQCPICGGSGKGTLPDIPQTAAVQVPSTCHGCNGKGWVSVEDHTTPVYSHPAIRVLDTKESGIAPLCNSEYWDGGVIEESNPPTLAEVEAKADGTVEEHLRYYGVKPGVAEVESDDEQELHADVPPLKTNNGLLQVAVGDLPPFKNCPAWMFGDSPEPPQETQNEREAKMLAEQVPGKPDPPQEADV